MKDRIKKIRKNLDLTQQEFANRIGIKRNTIANYETGRNTPVDSVVSLICREFNVNESWLRTGQGDMFVKVDDDTKLSEWTSSILTAEPTSFRRRFASMIASLSDEDWKWLEDKANILIHDSNSDSSISDQEESYIKSRFNSAKNMDSSASNSTAERLKNRA